MIATRLPARSWLVVPARGVHGDTVEGVDAVDVGRLRHGEHAAGVDHESGGHLAAGVELHPPQRPLVVELRGQHLGVEADLRPDAVLVGAVLGVGLQFVAPRVGSRPVRPLLERELVGKRRNVHGDTGIGVPVPGAADPVAGLDDEVVAEALLVELDGGADAREPRADDQAVVVGLRAAALLQRRFQGRQAAVGRLGGSRDEQREADVAVHQGGLVAQLGGHTRGVEQRGVAGPRRRAADRVRRCR